MNIALEAKVLSSVMPPLQDNIATAAPAIEFEFASFMQQQLQWKKVRLNNRPGSAAAIAERQNKQGQALKDMAILWYAFSIGFLIIGYALGFDSFFGEGVEQVLSWSGAVLLFTVPIFLFTLRRIHREKAWVACSQSNIRAGIDEIEKSLKMYWNYAVTSGKPYKFVEHYFVAAGGFTLDALQYALDNNITCYEKKDGQFKPVLSPVCRL
jgi:hypothetical protein